MAGIEVQGFCYSEVRDLVPEVVQRSHARAGDQSIKASQFCGRVKLRQSHPRPLSYHVTTSCLYDKAVSQQLS